MGFLDKSSVKLHEHPCSGIRVSLCRRADITELVVTFHNAANFPKMVCTYRLQNLILSTFWGLSNSVCNNRFIQIWLKSISARIKVFLSYDFSSPPRHLVNSWTGVQRLEGETCTNTQPFRYVMCIVFFNFYSLPNTVISSNREDEGNFGVYSMHMQSDRSIGLQFWEGICIN